jgi:hypothetical protein
MVTSVTKEAKLQGTDVLAAVAAAGWVDVEVADAVAAGCAVGLGAAAVMVWATSVISASASVPAWPPGRLQANIEINSAAIAIGKVRLMALSS